MRGRQAFRWAVVAVVALGIALAGAFGLRILGGGLGETASGDQPLATTMRTKQVDGQTHLLISKEALTAGDIALQPLKATEFQEHADALATIVSPQILLDQRRAYQTAAAEGARGELAARAARLELQRLQRLHRDDRIVSDKAVETAQVAAATEETGFRLARSQLGLQSAALNQQWGPILAGYLVNGSPELDRLLAGQDLLVEIAVPTSRFLTNPSVARIELSSGLRLDASIISGVPQADPKFQAQGFYAIMPANSRLLPRMTVSASLLVGPPLTGVEVPDDAVVRWQGKPFAYVEVAEGEFVRHAVPTGIATPHGWLVRSGLSAGSEVVIRGAQLLLSEEMKVQPPKSENR